MGQVKTLLGMYVPPGPQHMQRAFQAGNVCFNPAAATGVSRLISKDYARLAIS